MSADILDALADDWRRANARAEIRRAINQAAREHDGEVHIANVRPLLPDWIAPPMIGAVTCALVRARHLTPTGRYAPNGDGTNRNRTKAAQIYHLAAPIPEETT